MDDSPGPLLVAGTVLKRQDENSNEVQMTAMAKRCKLPRPKAPRSDKMKIPNGSERRGDSTSSIRHSHAHGKTPQTGPAARQRPATAPRQATRETNHREKSRAQQQQRRGHSNRDEGSSNQDTATATVTADGNAAAATPKAATKHSDTGNGDDPGHPSRQHATAAAQKIMQAATNSSRKRHTAQHTPADKEAASALVMNDKTDNESSISEFLLLEFSAIRELQILHFFLFLGLYLAIVSGNLLIISAVAFDHRLHTPMYFFLMNLAIQDIGAVSVTVPKSMANSLMNTRHISYAACVAQVLSFVFFLSSDIALLTVMAYDRYVAICNPLQYEMVMNRTACTQMVVAVWTASILYAVLHTSGTFATPFCSNIVNQFFCEIPQLLTLSCSNFYLIEIGVVVVSVILVFGCLVFIIVTYVHIFSAVLKIPSVQGRKKAFSTCIPHLIVFSVFCFTVCFAYLRPPSKTPSELDFALTMMYTLVPPMFNPIIYSMRNKEIKNALSKLLGLRPSSMNILSRLV
ncbi:olfactory receptor 14A16-like [Rhineura floridana]|uniref:olfactory receptor 14A16-like n=1 Tax=Rhineura floridana TaxID=261503 RepID=UPI002AC7FF99|nr:olfactory receptor 14A16-like [Rhineura floridana]